MHPGGSTGPEDGRSLPVPGIWAAPLVVLFGVWVWLAFSSGGYLPRQWLLGALVVGLFGLVVAALVAYPRRPRQLSLLVLSLFGMYAIWVGASALWADSTTRVWLETGRTFAFILVFALALVFLTDAFARRIFPYLVMAASFGLLVACLWRIWSPGDIAALFIENRLSYPVSYPNNAAALFLIGFWPLMWLAAGPKQRAPVRGIALGLATGLLALAIMTQSRGAIWSLAITVVVMFIVSPSRIRTLLYLLVPALLMVYEFPNLNRYWLDGPQTVGGSLAARTILVATITAAFIGMILALLERWVKVSLRMKAIFGTIILLGLLAGAVYGAVVVTSSVGGPIAWVSDRWQQFTGQAVQSPEGSSRFGEVSSSGRVGIWKVAWKEFLEDPALGVGADNFIFEYNRLRLTETYKPQQAHSIELQVLGETGIVGGVFAFGGMLLALGALLWGRSVAGWRGARIAWSRLGKSGDEPATGPVQSRFCKARWGDISLDYGWEMAVFTAAVYWLLHASVDWLWQMAGVAIPMILLLASGISGVDARVDTMWPRWRRWLRMSSEVDEPVALQAEGSSPRSLLSAAPNLSGGTAAESMSVDTTAPPGATAGEGMATPAPPHMSPATDTDSRREESFLTIRRSDMYLERNRRRLKRQARRQNAAVMLQPAGLLSHVFRALLVTLSLIVIVAVGLPYLSLQYQNSAMGLAKTDAFAAAKRAEAARWFQLADPGPYMTQAAIYTSAAISAAGSAAQDRAGSVLDDLALSMGSFTKAIGNEPADWALRYRAGVAAVNLLLATDCATGRTPTIDYPELIPTVPGLMDWASIAGAASDPAAPGQAAGSLALDGATQATAAHYRGLSRTELGSLAIEFLNQARARNPLAPEIAEAESLVRSLAGSVATR